MQHVDNKHAHVQQEEMLLVSLKLPSVQVNSSDLLAKVPVELLLSSMPALVWGPHAAPAGQVLCLTDLIGNIKAGRLGQLVSSEWDRNSLELRSILTASCGLPLVEQIAQVRCMICTAFLLSCGGTIR